MHAIHSTNDVEKTLAFYQDVFALNGQVRGLRPEGPADPDQLADRDR